MKYSKKALPGVIALLVCFTQVAYAEFLPGQENMEAENLSRMEVSIESVEASEHIADNLVERQNELEAQIEGYENKSASNVTENTKKNKSVTSSSKSSYSSVSPTEDIPDYDPENPDSNNYFADWVHPVETIDPYPNTYVPASTEIIQLVILQVYLTDTGQVNLRHATFKETRTESAVTREFVSATAWQAATTADAVKLLENFGLSDCEYLSGDWEALKEALNKILNPSDNTCPECNSLISEGMCSNGCAN